MEKFTSTSKAPATEPLCLYPSSIVASPFVVDTSQNTPNQASTSQISRIIQKLEDRHGGLCSEPWLEFELDARYFSHLTQLLQSQSFKTRLSYQSIDISN